MRCLWNGDNALMFAELQKRVIAWAWATFGDIALNRDERAARLVEEAIEVCQAESVAQDVVHRLVDRVYSRPVGDLGREIGGVAMTLAALAENAGYSVEAEAQRELDRVMGLSPAHFAAKHAEKVAAGVADLSPTRAARKLIDMPIAEARAAKMAAGRVKYGPEFVGDPLEELDSELIDAMNYCAEAEGRGVVLCGLQDNLRRMSVQVRSAYQRAQFAGED